MAFCFRGGWMKQKELYAKLEKRFTIFRWIVIFVVAPATTPLSDYSKNNIYFLLLLVLGGIYNLFLTIAAYSHNKKFLFLLKYTLFIDIPLISFVVFIRGGLRSDTFLLYFLIILYDGAKYGLRGTILSLGESIFFYALVSFLAPMDIFQLDTEPFSLNRFVIRIVYLITLSFVMYEINHMLSESYTKEQEARELAYKDPLTQLPNRLLMTENFERLRHHFEKKGQSFAISIMDIDNFKEINDKNGHAFGDKVLKALGEILMETLSQEDFICRFGGEEFLAFYAKADKDNILKRVNDLHEKIESYNFFGQKITVSIGINIYNDDYTMIENISLADEAMYAVKNTGKNKVLIYEKYSY